MYQNKQDSVIGKIESCELKSSGRNKSGEWNRYAVSINGDGFVTFCDDYADLVGQEGEWPFVVEEYVDKLGVERTQKKLLPPRKTKLMNDDDKVIGQIIDEGKLIRQISAEVHDIWLAVKAKQK